MTGALLAEVFFLGIAAFDPVGLAAMPILLSQPRGVTRSWVFVLGSMAALLGLGWRSRPAWASRSCISRSATRGSTR